jgi:hypothetical protein
LRDERSSHDARCLHARHRYADLAETDHRPKRRGVTRGGIARSGPPTADGRFALAFTLSHYRLWCVIGFPLVDANIRKEIRRSVTWSANTPPAERKAYEQSARAAQ